MTSETPRTAAAWDGPFPPNPKGDEREVSEALERELAAKEAELSQTKALLSATTADFKDIKGRFCEHHGTPGGCAARCPVCDSEQERAKVARLREAVENFCGYMIEPSSNDQWEMADGWWKYDYDALLASLDAQSKRDAAVLNLCRKIVNVETWPRGGTDNQLFVTIPKEFYDELCQAVHVEKT